MQARRTEIRRAAGAVILLAVLALTIRGCVASGAASAGRVIGAGLVNVRGER
jgi:hypothetical protein